MVEAYPRAIPNIVTRAATSNKSFSLAYTDPDDFRNATFRAVVTRIEDTGAHVMVQAVWSTRLTSDGSYRLFRAPTLQYGDHHHTLSVRRMVDLLNVADVYPDWDTFRDLYA